MREVRKTIIVAALAVAFLNLEAQLPVAQIVAWLMHLPGNPALAPG
jgi:hypothetical protein